MKTILTALNLYLITLLACLAAPAATTTPTEAATPGKISVETIGAVRFVGIDKGEQYGAGVGAKFSFNKHVSAWGRALAYETPDNWGGSTVDEAGGGVEATLFRTKGGGLSLSAVAGVNYEFARSDIGASIGGRTTARIWKSLYGFGQGEWRFWDKQESDILVSAGLGLKF